MTSLSVICHIICHLHPTKDICHPFFLSSTCVSVLRARWGGFAPSFTLTFYKGSRDKVSYITTCDKSVQFCIEGMYEIEFHDKEDSFESISLDKQMSGMTLFWVFLTVIIHLFASKSATLI